MGKTRQQLLLQLLISEDNYQTVAYFAKRLGVSQRTLHYELEEIEKSGNKITKKRGVGIKLISYKKLENLTHNTILQRRIDIMIKLLFDEVIVTQNDLANEYLVDVSSIRNDLRFISNVLCNNNKATLISTRQGTFLQTTNEQMINVLVNFSNYIIDTVAEQKNNTIEIMIDILSPYYDSKLLYASKNIVNDFLIDMKYIIPDTYVCNFFIVFISLLYCLKKDKHIENFKKSSKIYPMYHYKAVKILQEVETLLNIYYRDSDVNYLSQLLLYYRLENVINENFDNMIMNQLLNKLSKVFDIDFSRNQELKQQLSLHISTMIKRIKMSNYLKYPLTQQIKNKYGLVFHMIWLVINEIEHEISTMINEDEIALLTIYFQLAIEKGSKKKKILIVCPMGLATSQLLFHRIQQHFPNSNIVEVVSISQLEQLDLTKFEYILSTVILEYKNYPIITVSPFITSLELHKKIQSYQKELEISTESFSINKNLIELLEVKITNYKNKDHLISMTTMYLQDKNLVTNNFKKSVSDREKMGSTALPIGVAIPHGDINTVNQTFVMLIKNNRKIKWGNYYVDIIFIVGIPSKDIKKSKKILSEIYNVINHSVILKKIRKTNNIQDIKDCVVKNGQ